MTRDSFLGWWLCRFCRSTTAPAVVRLHRDQGSHSHCLKATIPNNHCRGICSVPLSLSLLWGHNRRRSCMDSYTCGTAQRGKVAPRQAKTSMADVREGTHYTNSKASGCRNLEPSWCRAQGTENPIQMEKSALSKSFTLSGRSSCSLHPWATLWDFPSLTR